MEVNGFALDTINLCKEQGPPPLEAGLAFY